MMHILGSPFNVTVEFQDQILYESYEDLSISGVGVTNRSEVFLMPPVVYAGHDF